MSGTAGFIFRRLANMILAIIVIVLLWQVTLDAFHVNEMIGKRPAQVWDYMMVQQDATQHRMQVFHNLGITLRDAGIGYCAGLAFAFLIAWLFCLFPIAENIVMPTAMVLRSIPLVVMTPLITLIMGIGQSSVTTLVIIVVFLPALANILFGLRDVPTSRSDLIKVYGGNIWTLFRVVALPGSVPSLMASAKVSIPSAVVGAMIAEWLSTGDGLGGSISKSVAMFSYAQMWASAIAIALVTMIAYSCMAMIDDVVSGYFEDHA